VPIMTKRGNRPPVGQGIPYVFGFGMPKCGTTTLAAMLGMHSGVALHSQKEPGDFLLPAYQLSGVPSGYRVTSSTRYLLDFTTQYGVRGNRERFYSNLASNHLVDCSRVILCLKDPSLLASSYMRHMLLRGHLSFEKHRRELIRDVLAACDFRGAVQFLSQRFAEGSVFVVRFDDLICDDRQEQVVQEIFSWLSLRPHPIGEKCWENATSVADRYPLGLGKLAARVRRTSTVRNMSPVLTNRIRRALSVPVDRSLDVVDSVSWSSYAEIADAACLYGSISSGPLSATFRP